MKIAICCSFTHIKDASDIKNKLENIGHTVIMPHNADLYISGMLSPETREESTQNKIKNDLIRQYFEVIKNSDAILAVNKDKNGIQNYIGPNTFLEIGFAHVLNKKVFLLNPIPDQLISDEILAMEHMIINNDLTKIK